MKRIYKIGTKQNFTYTTCKFFKKKIKTEECWIIRNVKYIYADNQEDAREKYIKWFFKEYESVSGWRDWYLESNNVDILSMDLNRTSITSTVPILIDDEKDIDVDYKKLKENMQAENFREWWFSKEEKHGKWEFKGTAYGCSICGEGSPAPIHRYCPNCGAKMGLGEEE